MSEQASRQSGEMSRQVLQTMINMQADHNAHVAQTWRTDGFAFYRAIWIECGELLDHFGWKWWKHQTPDVEQVQLELVDIWHFGLSVLMLELGEDAQSAQWTPVYEALNAPVRPATADAFRANIEALAQDCLARQGFSVSVFAEVMLTLPMTAGELAALYLGKNTLNVFRQAHGYKTGEYRKLWQGREDNVHLMEIMKDVDLSSQQVTEDIYVRLSARYETSSS